MRAAFTFVDTIYAATLGDEAVAAIGLTVPLEFGMIAIWIGLSSGLTSVLSRAVGAGQCRRIEQYLGKTWTLVSIVSPVFLAVGIGIWFYAPRMGLETALESSFRIYGTTIIAGSALTTFWSVIPDSVVKAHQDTRSTMWAGIISNVINLALNTLFLFVFHWGVFGIALSTVLGRIGGLVYALHKARQHERRRCAEDPGTDLSEDPAPQRAILSLAVPGSVGFLLMALETAAVNWLLSLQEHATEVLTAYSIYYRIALFAINPVIAAGVALLPYTARRFGRKDFAGIRRGLRETYLATVGYVVFLVTPVMLFGAPWFAAKLADDSLAVDYTKVVLWVVPVACLAGAPFLICRPVFEGMQQGRPGLVMALIRYLVLTFPLAWGGIVLAGRTGYPALYGMVAGLLLTTILASLGFALWLQRALATAQSD
jgi:Na+-driven multidrug efflux pump